jgi:hypothetical protein
VKILHRCSGNLVSDRAALDVSLSFLYIGRLSVYPNVKHRFERRTVRLNEVAGGRYMSWKRLLVAGIVIAGFGVGTQSARAEDPPPPTDSAPAAPEEAPKKKDPFFGDHFAMYLETRGGPSSIDTIDNSISSGVKSNSDSHLSFDGSKSGQFTAGWTLPRGRGQYLLTYTGISDGNFKLDATGTQQSYRPSGSQQPIAISFALPWWQVTVRDGQLTTTKTPPVWNSNIDDANGNGIPDPDEIRFPTTTINLAASVPKSLGNRIQTWDLYYRREYGGVKIRARWTAGLRYLKFDGALATPAWVASPSSTVGFGYTDGVQNDLIIMQQATSGWGPVGSGEVDFNFFRQRLTLYAMVQAAFLLETLDTDSGSFTFLARDPAIVGAYFPGIGRIQDNVSKSTWNTTFEAGLRVKVLQGFDLILDWNTTGYLDTMLIPNTLSIPDNSSQIALGTTARFVSRDFVVSSINLGLSFQF